MADWRITSEQLRGVLEEPMNALGAAVAKLNELQIRKLVEWGNEWCKDHLTSPPRPLGTFLRRFDCPDCMGQLKREANDGTP